MVFISAAGRALVGSVAIYLAGVGGSAEPALAAVQPVIPHAAVAAVDYAPATWVAAATTNYTVASRPNNYEVEMIVIHDIEGSAGSAIKTFQDPNRHGSAHYIVSYGGKVWQMVMEKNVAWHAGNWDYNTRSIGIEHEGYAWTPGLYTTAEYDASAKLAASICSRWGVALDRNHVIGHSEVPDPFHPGLKGGDSHHTDPGPYWNWSFYLSHAKYFAASLPSPPFMKVEPVAVPDDQSATVSWTPASTCHSGIDTYHVVAQPGNIVQDVPGTTTSATFTGLNNGTHYSFSVTAINEDGQSTLTSNNVIAGPHCSAAALATNMASPQYLSSKVQLTASSSTCPNPTYRFFIQLPSGKWQEARGFGGGTGWTWDTTFIPAGTYTLRVWANQSGDRVSAEAFSDVPFTFVEPPKCTSASVTPSTATQVVGTSTINFTASSAGCPLVLYSYWVQYPNGVWSNLRSLSTTATFNWNTAGLAPGTYTFHVWANHPGKSTKSPEVYASSTIKLTGCTAVSVTPSSGSSARGVPVKFTASGVKGCPNPAYQFWIQDVHGGWHLMQSGSSNTWTWNNAGWGKGVYHIHVWANQQNSYQLRQQAYATSTRTVA